MHWTEPASSDDSHSELETKLWGAANQLWANAALKPSEFSPIVLGLIFLRYADVRFQAVAEEIGPSTGRRKIGPADYHAKGVLYLPEETRFGHLLQLPEGGNIGQAVNDAMRAVEKENPDLADVLPKTYQILENRTLAELLKVMASIPMDKGGDTFGLIYEYFLGKFAMSEGQKGGEFYTPTSIVRLIVEILEPYHGRIYDPACGSGGMFVQSARFVENHHKNPTREISCHGQERVTETSRLARLNLAVHGLSGDIRQGNTYYEDLHNSTEPCESSPSPQPSPRGRGGVQFQGLKERAREMRKKGTPAENCFWELVRNRQFENLKFRRQHQIGDYIVDFYCHEASLIVEFDGAAHDRGSRKKHDKKRDAYLTSLGNTVLRYENSALFDNPESIFRQIASKLPSPHGRGAGGEGHEVERHGRFDFVMANPPFNVSKIDKERLADDPRYAFGLPRTDNGNYLWIQHFHSALNATGRAGFVMANSAADARASEQEIREKLIRSGHVDVMVSIGPKFFYTVALPCTLWFFDKGKTGTPREDTVLFLDARHVFRKLSAAHHDFTPAQTEFLANVVRFYRGEDLEFEHGSEAKWVEVFGDATGYVDVPGLCKAATRAEIEAQGWSLNPGRYVGVAKGEDLSDEDFKERLEALNEELEVLNAEARELEERIAANVAEILETA